MMIHRGQTDRFAALVTHDGVFDAMGMYYSSEETVCVSCRFTNVCCFCDEDDHGYDCILLCSSSMKMNSVLHHSQVKQLIKCTRNSPPSTM
jgi:hypothetical protein